jgi:hypothetical protein
VRYEHGPKVCPTTAAERQDPDFLISPCNKRNRKKGRPLKFFIHRSKLQAGTSDVDCHRESQLIGAITRPRSTTACSGQKTVGVQREDEQTRTGICVLNFIRNASLQFGPVDEEFQWSTFFSSWRSAAGVLSCFAPLLFSAVKYLR